MSASIAQLHSWRRGFFGTPRFACSGYARRSWRLAATRAAPRRLSCATAYFHHRCDLLGRSRPLASYGAKFPASDLVLRKSLVLPPIAILPPSMRSNTTESLSFAPNLSVAARSPSFLRAISSSVSLSSSRLLQFCRPQCARTPPETLSAFGKISRVSMGEQWVD
jgi:hypothetical protein